MNTLMRGSNGDDTLVGSMLADTLWGARGNDVIYGRAGKDYILDSSGSDTMYGGAGADTFVFTAAEHSAPQHQDYIADFQRGIDKIDLSSLNLDGSSDLHIYSRKIAIDFDHDGHIEMIIRTNTKVYLDDIIL